MQELVSRIKSAWSKFDLASIEEIEPLYADDAVFIEPAGEIQGRERIFNHFRQSCDNLIDCRFEFDDTQEVIGENRACLVWTMHFRQQKLQSGKLLTASGITLFNYDNQITLHRDWFDLGEMVYENLPLMGVVVRLIKGRLQYQT